MFRLEIVLQFFTVNDTKSKIVYKKYIYNTIHNNYHVVINQINIPDIELQVIQDAKYQSKSVKLHTICKYTLSF